jgi:hypothetical protein
MRGRKSYNIRNIEAHINSYKPVEPQPYLNPDQFSRNIVFQTNAVNVIQPSEQQRQNEYINAKYGVSRYASNLVSGRMFKNL